MPISCSDDLARIDWSEASALYRAAPLGDKAPADLELVFGNSMFRVFAFDAGEPVGAARALADGRDCAYLCDIAVRPSHQGTGLHGDLCGPRQGLHRRISARELRGPIWR
jgi:Acetyltransferase (GNAT) family